MRLGRADWAWTIAAAIVLAFLARLPPHGFFSGDSGVKLVMAESAAAHPSRPTDVDLPRVAGEPAADYLDPFFVAHGDHAHAIQSALFPMLTAPFVALLGTRGAYVLPAVAFIAMVPLLAIAGRRMGLPIHPVVLGAFAVCVNPLLFYALELWEHTPAAAALAASLALAFGARRVEWAASGVLAAIATLLRPEALWCALGLGIALASSDRRQPAVVGAACAATLVAGMASWNWLHFGSPFGIHVAGNMRSVLDQWLQLRAYILSVWFPITAVSLAGVALLVAAWVLPSGPLVGYLGAATFAAGAIASGLARETFWLAAPAAGLACVPHRGATGRPGIRALYIAAVIGALGVCLSAPNDGGAQWGPRYLLIVTPMVMLLAATAATAALDGRRMAAMACVGVVLVCGLAASRDAYRTLRASKQVYAGLVDALDSARAGAGTIVTDVWWLDQIAASLRPHATFLYVDSIEQAQRLGRRLQDRRAGDFVLVTSATEPRLFAEGEPRLPGSCFRFSHSTTLPLRGLNVYTPTCSPE